MTLDAAHPRLVKFCGPLFTAGAGYLTAYAAVGSANFAYIAGLPVFSTTPAIAAAVLTAASLIIRLRSGGGPLLRTSVSWMLVPFLLVLLSDFVSRRFVFFLGAGVREAVLYLGASALFISALRSGGLRAGLPRFFSFGLLVILQCAVTAAFIKYAWGRIVFTDDHPSFVYRLLLLREEFPHIPFYNTAWNGGYIATEFFATGAMGLFIMTAPILYLMSPPWTVDTMRLYTLVIPYLFVFVVPLSLYTSCRLMRMGRSASAICALLGFAPSLSCTEWALKYGTLPFSLSMGLYPLLLALVYRLFVDRRPTGLKLAVFAVPVTAVGLAWPVASLLYVPFAVVTLVYLRSALSRKHAWVYLGLSTLLLGPWFYVFLTRGPVVAVLSRNTLPGVHADHQWEAKSAPQADATSAKPAAEKKAGRSWSSALGSFRDNLVRIYPLILLFGIAGLARLRDRRWAILLGASILYLAVLSIIGTKIKPQLELKRMIIPATFLLCAPASAAIQAALRRLSCRLLKGGTALKIQAGAALVVLLGSVLLVPVYGAAFLLNRSIERYSFAPEYFPGLVEAIKAHGGSGRTVFFGFILHDLGPSALEGGHIAPLAALTGRQLYASSPYHSRWSAADPIPDGYRKRGRDGIEEFLDLVNATAVVAFRQPWIGYCEKDSNYREVFRGGNFRVYTRGVSNPSFVDQGSAEVQVMQSGLIVRPQTDTLVLRFRYFPQLKVEPENAAELYPFHAFDEDVGGGMSERFNYIGVKLRRAGEHPELKISLGP